MSVAVRSCSSSRSHLALSCWMICSRRCSRKSGRGLGGEFCKMATEQAHARGGVLSALSAKAEDQSPHQMSELENDHAAFRPEIRRLQDRFSGTRLMANGQRKVTQNRIGRTSATTRRQRRNPPRAGRGKREAANAGDQAPCPCRGSGWRRQWQVAQRGRRDCGPRARRDKALRFQSTGADFHLRNRDNKPRSGCQDRRCVR